MERPCLSPARGCGADGMGGVSCHILRRGFLGEMEQAGFVRTVAADGRPRHPAPSCISSSSCSFGSITICSAAASCNTGVGEVVSEWTVWHGTDN